MEDELNTTILFFLFIILLVVIFKTIKNNMNFGNAASMVLSICISALAIIGLSKMKGGIGVILIPYAAMALAIILMILIIFLVNIFSKTKRKFPYNFNKKFGCKLKENEKDCFYYSLEFRKNKNKNI